MITKGLWKTRGGDQVKVVEVDPVVAFRVYGIWQTGKLAGQRQEWLLSGRLLDNWTPTKGDLVSPVTEGGAA